MSDTQPVDGASRGPMTVLFADPDHGPRGQLAAAVLQAADGVGSFEVSSAGSAPGGDLTGVAEVLAERGISFEPTFRQLDLSMAPDLMMVVCEEGCAACPYLPRAARIIRWPFEDPTVLSPAQRADALHANVARLQDLSAQLIVTRLRPA